MAGTGPHSERLVTSSLVLQDIEVLALLLAPNTLYKFKFLIHFRGADGIALSINGPLRPTFSGFRAETPLSTAAVPLLFGWGGNFVTALPADGDTGVVELSGVIRTGVAGGTLVPRFAARTVGIPAEVTLDSYGTIYDQSTSS